VASQTRPPRRALDALFGPAGVETLPDARLIDVGRLTPSPTQVRTTDDPEERAALVASVRAHGVLEPVLVRASKDAPGAFELIAGERRWRAAREAGQDRVPAIVLAVDDETAEDLGLQENLVRATLPPLDEARAYQRLRQRRGYTLRQIAERVHVSHTTIRRRLLLLAQERIAAAVARGDLGQTAGQALAALTDEERKATLLERVEQGERLGVREIAGAPEGADDELSASHAVLAPILEHNVPGSAVVARPIGTPTEEGSGARLEHYVPGLDPLAVPSPAPTRAGGASVEPGLEHDVPRSSPPDPGPPAAQEGRGGYIGIPSPQRPAAAHAPTAAMTPLTSTPVIVADGLDDTDAAPAAGVVRVRLLGASEDEVTALVLELSQALGDRLQVERAQQGRKGDYLCYARVAPRGQP